MNYITIRIHNKFNNGTDQYKAQMMMNRCTLQNTHGIEDKVIFEEKKPSGYVSGYCGVYWVDNYWR